MPPNTPGGLGNSRSTWTLLRPQKPQLSRRQPSRRLAGMYSSYPGQHVVAIDGIACTTEPQYSMMRDLNPGKPLDIIYWDGKRYHRLVADLPERRLQVALEALEEKP